MCKASLRVGVKYCGGCNPRFDRVGFVQRLTAVFPYISFTPAHPEEVFDLLLVVCGCTARCAAVNGLVGRLGALTVCSPEDFSSAEAFLSHGLEQAMSSK